MKVKAVIFRGQLRYPILNISHKNLIRKSFIAVSCDNGWLLFLWNPFIIVNVILWKPWKPVSNATKCWKHFGSFVIIRSMLEVFSRQVLLLIRLLQTRHRGKVKHELQVAYYESDIRVMSPNLGVASSNPQVRRLKARVGRLKARVSRLKSRVELIKPWVQL